jgi:hypothetical protein
MKLQILLAASLFALVAKAQQLKQDCINAISVCYTTYNYSNWGIEGNGNYSNEINGTNSCLSSGDTNVVWFKVYTTQPGVLKFTIQPYDATADYNWAVFNLTQANCFDIFDDPTLEVSCNSSTSVTNNGYTGPNGGSELQDEQGINVGDGEWYYIAISSPSTEKVGFILDFTGSTSLGGSNPLEFVNQSPPNLVPANQVYVYFNQPVFCNSISVSDFRVYDSNNQDIPIASVYKPYCSNSLYFTSSCILFLGTDLVEGMQYKVTKVGDMQTGCTNIDTGYTELVFIAPPAADPIISYENKPEQDCITAMPVCSANMYINGSYTGEGLVSNELDVDIQTCLGSGEVNSVWFRIPIESDGDLNFTIRPTDYNADLDWAIYNLTNANCSDIFTNPTLETSCNFSGTTNPLGITGANGGYYPAEEPVIPVVIGQMYYLLVTNYSGTFTGFQLDMTESTCGIGFEFNETFSDNFTPAYFPPYNLQVMFNSYIACSSVQATDFTLFNTQTGFNYTITNVEPYLCNGSGDSTANKFQLAIFPQLASNTSYTIVRDGQIQNLCGFQSTGSDSIVFAAVITGINEVVSPAFTVNTLADDKAIVTSSMPLSGNINLYNLAGMLMQTHWVENTSSVELPMDGYTQGLYILSFTNTQGQTYSTKIVKVDN